MFKAEFYINSNPDFKNFPCFSFVNEKVKKEFWMLGELVFCDKDYIINIVLPNLDKVMSDDLTNYEFGFDATIIDFYKDKSIINYNFFENTMEIDSEDIYHFMQEWRNYLVEWKKNQE